MSGPRPVARFTYRYGRIRAIGDVQSQRMQGVGEVVRFESMAGDAGFLTDRSRVRGLRIHRNVRIRESRRRPRQSAAIRRAVRGKIRRGKRIGRAVSG